MVALSGLIPEAVTLKFAVCPFCKIFSYTKSGLELLLLFVYALLSTAAASDIFKTPQPNL